MVDNFIDLKKTSNIIHYLFGLLMKKMIDQEEQIIHNLLAIEVALRQLNYWQEAPLPVEAYISELPFCHDTMKFPQWL